MAVNSYPWWKNCLVVIVVIFSFLYSAPMLYGDDPAVQILAASPTTLINDTVINKVKQVLQTANLPYKQLQSNDHDILVRFVSTDDQLKAKELIQTTLGEQYLVALDLAPATPEWLKSINAHPMKLGLDLRGGVHLLMQVDVDTILKQRVEGDLSSVGQSLRSERIRYSSLVRQGTDGLSLQFRNQEALDNAYTYLMQHYSTFTWTKNSKGDQFEIQGVLAPAALYQVRQDTMEQTMNTLRNRVNELGVSEAVVQQQGASRIAVDLPGIQDAAQAKDILGKTATLEFHLVDTEHDPRGIAPIDTKVYDYNGQPVLLKNPIILRGSAITSASSGFGEDGRPSVNVRLGGGGESLFTKTTAENIGKPMAVLYVEVKSTPKIVDGKKTIEYENIRRVISVATIQSALANSFQITGLSSAEESRTLALLLRAGALPVPVTIIEERQVGPSLGKQNIHMGVMSVEVGFFLVVIFMILYYRGMGLIADIALGMNLVLIVAIMSLLGATLTLPGIAAIVLNVGMAVDANVLIFERIREELRNGAGVQASIHAGYERAFTTIVDANLTTLIVAIVLFGLGSGAVKSFAVALTVAVITSMFTAITGTRMLVNLIYGKRAVKKISIGI